MRGPSRLYYARAVNGNAPPRWPRRLVAAGVLLFLVGPGLAWAGVVPPIVGFGLFAVSALLGLLGALVGGVALVRRRADRATLLIVAVGLVLTAMVAGPAVLARDSPPINDISTDVEDPPAFRHAATALPGVDLSYPEAFLQPARVAYPDVQPLASPVAPAAVYAAALKVAEAQPGWELVTRDPDARVVEAVARTPLFRFEDDVTIHILPGTPGGSVVQVRSRSRVGKGDLGANARRIRTYLAALRAALEPR